MHFVFAQDHVLKRSNKHLHVHVLLHWLLFRHSRDSHSLLPIELSLDYRRELPLHRRQNPKLCRVLVEILIDRDGHVERLWSRSVRLIRICYRLPIWARTRCLLLRLLPKRLVSFFRSSSRFVWKWASIGFVKYRSHSKNFMIWPMLV